MRRLIRAPVTTPRPEPPQFASISGNRIFLARLGTMRPVTTPRPEPPHNSHLGSEGCARHQIMARRGAPGTKSRPGRVHPAPNHGSEGCACSTPVVFFVTCTGSNTTPRYACSVFCGLEGLKHYACSVFCGLGKLKNYAVGVFWGLEKIKLHGCSVFWGPLGGEAVRGWG